VAQSATTPLLVFAIKPKEELRRNSSLGLSAKRCNRWVKANTKNAHQQDCEATHGY
jgi:hypothetical protein